MDFTLEDMRRVATKIIRKLASSLEKTGNFAPSIHVVMPDDEVKELPFPPWVMNSGDGKDILFGAMREFAQKNKVKAVIFASDTWIHQLTEEEVQRVQTDEEFRQRYHDIAKNMMMSVDKMVAAGIGYKAECIMVTIQTPLVNLLVTQFYERKGADGRHIILGERKELDNTKEGSFTGRVFVWPDKLPENV